MSGYEAMVRDSVERLRATLSSWNASDWTKSTMVLVVEKPDGKRLAFAVVDGNLQEHPEQITSAAGRAAYEAGLLAFEARQVVQTPSPSPGSRD